MMEATDGSTQELRRLAGLDPQVRVLEFVRNFGQTAAIAAGFDHARGQIIIPLDADLQNDPQDIPLIMEKLEEGYDVVNCWRRDRKDPWLTRIFPSRLANRLISWISGVSLHDYGCTLKGYRRDTVRHIRLYGEMHRFIPIFASWAGARVAEIPVRHHPSSLRTLQVRTAPHREGTPGLDYGEVSGKLLHQTHVSFRGASVCSLFWEGPC